MKNGENFDRIGVHAIHEAVRPLDELAEIGASELGYDAAGLRELTRLVQAMRQSDHGTRHSTFRAATGH